jgi:hippurate hydrolase
VDRFGQSVSIAHACGHDVHVTWLMGASRVLAEHRGAWRGTAMVVFQPGEETGQGARAMVADGMVERFPKPDVALGQHVMPLPAGRIGYRAGTMLTAGDSWEIRLFGRGAHGSAPQRSIDPVVMAAATVMRLQTIVSREVAMTEGAVVTVGALQAGTNENVIPETALLRLNIRTFDPAVRERVLASVRRIVEAEASASGSPKPPTFDVISEYPLTRNDASAMRKVVEAFGRRFGPDALQEIGPSTASEDFGRFGEAWKVPSMFWVVGGTDPEAYRAAEAAGKVGELPVNHAPDFAPVLDPTLRVGVEAMVAAAGAWLEAGP